MNQRYADQSVLVVDDERFVLKTTAFVLQRLGYGVVLTADSAARALELIASAEPPVSLVISDLNMPGMDGVELLRRFDELGFDGDIVLFSGEDNQTLKMAENLARARKLSILGAISKPIQPELLSQILAGASTRPAMPASTRTPQQVTAVQIEEAIEAGEFEPWFQPKIDIASRMPVGVEVLARWPRAIQGPIFPDAFIPVAEESGLIDRLTLLLLEKAACFGKAWRDQGLDLKIALNVSMDSLKDLDLPDRLCELIARHGEPLNRYQLEVTESRLMEDKVTALDVLLRLRMKRINLSIDDFGTGHSNISQLRDLPFDELKLDRSYVQAAADGDRNLAILESTVEMAKKLDLIVVAEGVENLEEWQRIEALGCSQVQGYFTARPMPGEAIHTWAGDWPQRCRELFGA